MPRPMTVFLRPEEEDRDLDTLSTRAEDLRIAHEKDAPDAARDAKARIFVRYQRAILRYIRAAVPDINAAEDILADFFAKLVNGSFRNFNADRGRFRDYVKGTLFRMVKDYYNGPRRKYIGLTRDIVDPSPNACPEAAMEAKFLSFWRESLMLRAWETLKDLERWNDRPYTMVLSLSIPPDRRPAREIALQLPLQNGRPATEGFVRTVRMEAAHALQDFVLAEVWDSIQDPSADRVEQELADLGLLKDLTKAIQRRANNKHRRRPGGVRRADIRSDSPAPMGPLLGSVASAPH